ncbi:hypothetical protein [Pseudolabrys sp. FHR47]|uniref:hypothetical protein n=1 Tax=Pseudolabrys sp. FHR47 TaxID=2562284 RepID=UPI0010BE9E14|nr:hypothetical protein [Pseudolabrys sp. FHR47]
MPLLIRKDGPGGLLPPIASILNRLQGPLFNAEWGLQHPLAIFNRRWTTFEQSLVAVLDALDGWHSPRANDETSEHLLKSQKNLLYDATELIEDFEKNMLRAVLSRETYGKNRFSLSKGLRNHVVVQCNKMKHAHAYLGFVEARYQFAKIPGYSVFSLTEPDTLGPEKNIHQQREAFSFSIELRKIVSNVYLLADEVTQEIIKHATLSHTEPDNKISDRTSDILRRVNDLPRLAFPSERPAHMPIYHFDGTTLEIDDKGGEIHHASGNSTISASHVGDGVTKRFRVPIV